ESPRTWNPFADSASVLKAFKARGLKLGALSNIDNASLEISRKKLGTTFDVVVTAERVGAYKPDWPHFRVALAELAALGIAKSRALAVAQGRRADIVPAGSLGLKRVWVRRPGAELGNSAYGAESAKADLEVDSLRDLLAAIG